MVVVVAVVAIVVVVVVAAETVVVMLIYIDQQVRQHPPKSLAELSDAIQHGAVLRVRPLLMTALTTMVGLLPIFITEGLGSDVMRRIALPMVGGMVTVTVLTLIVIPVIYYLWEGRRFQNIKVEN